MFARAAHYPAPGVLSVTNSAPDVYLLRRRFSVTHPFFARLAGIQLRKTANHDRTQGKHDETRSQCNGHIRTPLRARPARSGCQARQFPEREQSSESPDQQPLVQPWIQSVYTPLTSIVESQLEPKPITQSERLPWLNPTTHTDVAAAKCNNAQPPNPTPKPKRRAVADKPTNSTPTNNSPSQVAPSLDSKSADSPTDYPNYHHPTTNRPPPEEPDIQWT